MHKHLAKPPNVADRPPILVTEADAAVLLSISPRSLWTLRKAGRIPFVKIHSCVRYRVADIEAFAAGNATVEKEAA